MCSWNLSMSFFFFKQKTAYEMRISDWSSDVCSADLLRWAMLSPGASCAFHPISEDQACRSCRCAKRGGGAPDNRPGPARAVPVVEAARVARGAGEIGRASCRERVCRYVEVSVVCVSLKIKIANR